jgi:addiction module RelE/StbE family toxin
MGLSIIMKVDFSETARKELENAFHYIADQGYPERALKYTERIEQFCHSLSIMPDKYSICRHKRFARWQYRCAVFESSYVIVYKVHSETVFILRVLHGKQIK